MNEINMRRIGGVDIFRPRPEAEVAARYEAERHLRSVYPAGTYTNDGEINDILHHQFAHFETVLHTEIAKSASFDLIEFLLAQYDASSQIEELHKRNELSDSDRGYWAEQGPAIRRSIKYLAELVTSLAPSQPPALPRNELIHNLERIVICGEELVKFYILSDQTHGVHPENTTFRVFPEGGELYYELDVDYFSERIRLDTQRRDEFIDGKVNVDLDFQGHELDAAFNAEFGLTYCDSILTLRHLIDTTVVPDQRFDVPFVRREGVVDAFHEDKGWPRESAGLVLDGFSVTQTAMEEDGRVIYKPQQEYRALRRGFFEMPHETGVHLMWSRSMARECLRSLVDGTVFQRLPSEWQKPRTKKALADLQTKAGEWFEMQVGRNMRNLGAIGRTSLKKGIGIAPHRLPIPPNIGDIDYLGYFPDQRLLVVLEAKMVDCGTLEPRYLRDDISSFVTAKKPYADQLRRKVKWTRENVAAVCRGLSLVLPGRPTISPTRIAGALITLYPTYASYSINDNPCVALSELMTAFCENETWPYDIGVLDIC